MESVLRKRIIRLLFLMIGAVLMATTLIFSELWLLEWVFLIPAGFVIYWISEQKMKVRTLYGYGLFFFWCYYIVVFHWFISMYPLSFTGLSKAEALIVVLLGVFGLSLLQAFFSGFVFVLFGLLSRTKSVRRFGFLRPFLFAALWTLFEWFQNFGWWGVPWGRLPLGQSEFGYTVQTASLFGSYFVTFLILSVNLCIAYCIAYIKPRQIAAMTAAGIFFVNLLCGVLLTATDREELGAETVRVAAIQGNISNKWEADTLEVTWEAYERLTREAAKEGAQLIVWPETALPFPLNEWKSSQERLSSLAVSCNAVLLVGAFRYEKSETAATNEYNSIYVVNSDGTFYDLTYDKQKLVPFGEFVPMRDLIMKLVPMLSDVGMLDNDVTAGKPGQILETEFGKIGSIICFDSIYESTTLRETQNGAGLFCLSSNDAWFLDSAAIYMHHRQAILRAIENRRYLVRAGNSGITSVISPTGKILTEIEPLIEGYVISDVCFREETTLYTKIGNAFIGLLIAFVAAVPFLSPLTDRIKTAGTGSEKREGKRRKSD